MPLLDRLVDDYDARQRSLKPPSLERVAADYISQLGLSPRHGATH